MTSSLDNDYKSNKEEEEKLAMALEKEIMK